MALRALAYMAVMGTPGMTRVAQACVEGIEYFRQQLAKIPGYTVPSGGTHFRELLVRTKKPASHIVEALTSRGFQGGIPVSSQEILFSITEVHTLQDIDDFVSALADLASEARLSE
jgi:glycine cleavage system pyridoxal-binding protein P